MNRAYIVDNAAFLTGNLTYSDQQRIHSIPMQSSASIKVYIIQPKSITPSSCTVAMSKRGAVNDVKVQEEESLQRLRSLLV